MFNFTDDRFMTRASEFTTGLIMFNVAKALWNKGTTQLGAPGLNIAYGNPAGVAAQLGTGVSLQQQQINPQLQLQFQQQYAAQQMLQLQQAQALQAQALQAQALQAQAAGQGQSVSLPGYPVTV